MMSGKNKCKEVEIWREKNWPHLIARVTENLSEEVILSWNLKDAFMEAARGVEGVKAS